MAAWPLTESFRILWVSDPAGLGPAGILQQLILNEPEPDSRRNLYFHALDGGRGRYRQAVLRQLADEPSIVAGGELDDLPRLLVTDTLAEDLPLLARIVAAVAAHSDVTPDLMELWHDVLRVRDLSWPVGAEEVFRRAFAAEGLPLPEWSGEF